MILTTVIYFVIPKYIKNACTFYICLDLHPTAPIICFGVIGFIASIIMALLFDGPVLPKKWNDIGILLFAGMLMLLGQFLTTIALKMELAGKVALTVKSSQILFSFMFQILIFDVS